MKTLESVQIEGQNFPVVVRRNKRSKRLTLRVCPKDRVIKVTLPMKMSLRRAEDFIKSHESWIQERLGKVPPEEFPQLLTLLGEIYVPKIDPLRRKAHICHKENLIYLPPRKSAEALRVVLIAYAKEVLASICQDYAEQLGHSIKNISIRDPKSRWGSCSSEGKLMLSWRLILAPSEVARYVCVHEVCHLVHLNHSAEFWELVASFDPTYKARKQWLKKNGNGLYGV